MSEKRFILQNGLITDNLTGFNYSNLNELCKLLNQINERADKNAEMNEQLRPKLKTYYKGKTSDEMVIESLKRENQELQNELYGLRWKWNNLKGIALVEYSDGNAKKIPLFYEVMTKLENGEFEDE